MLDLFTIFTKGGIVLWCFKGTNQLFNSSVNALIRSVILQVCVISCLTRIDTHAGNSIKFQERSGLNSFEHDGLTLQYKLDNEFELVFVVAFQRILQLAYIGECVV